MNDGNPSPHSLCRRPPRIRFHPPVNQVHDAATPNRQSIVVRDDHECRAVARVERPQQPEHLRARLAVQVAHRLIGQDKRRSHHQRSGERHRLGAEYTPREYIERLVEPTVVEPIRERWTAVQAAVIQLAESGKKKDRDRAIKQLRDFHAWLRGLQFLNPACGSGNFLYVTMAAVKRIELEVISATERVGGKTPKEAILEEVHPRQFHGIEIKP